VRSNAMSRVLVGTGAVLCLSGVTLGGGLGSAAGASGSATIPTASVDSTLAATVPAAVKTSGLLVAADATYAPDEFIGSDGTTVVGMDADLANAIGQVLGVKVTITNATFDTIIPALQSGKFNMGASSFTDTKARQKQVDFVNYFQAGEGYYVKAGSSYKPNGLAALCGHTVAVETGTVEQTDAASQAKKCTKAHKGNVKVLAFADQNSANLAVSSGRAQVGFLDSQIAEYVVATSNGQFKNSGTAFGIAPYGLALPKGLGLTRPVDGAVGQLMKDGIYLKILKKWGIQAGALSRPEINGATS
jgi:polar amino acid transport system substrate-binding protein